MQKTILRIYFLLAGVEGIIVLLAILANPSEASGALILGLTLERLLIFSFIFILTLGFTVLGLSSWTHPFIFKRIKTFLVGLSGEGKSSFWVTAALIALGVLSIEILQFLFSSSDYIYYAYLERVMPVLLWITLIVIQSLIIVFLLRHGSNWFEILKKNHFHRVTLTFLVFVAIWRLLSQVNLGISQRTIAKGIFHYPGTPLLGTQVIMALLFVLGSLAIIKILVRWFPGFAFLQLFQSNIFLGILIWMAAVITWMSVPLESNWFAEAPRSPNYEFYPNSDAVYYDKFAQNLIIGEGFGDPLVRRPIYVLFLALSHVIAGLGYEGIIWLQVLVLGAIPVAIFGVTSSLHTRVSGIFVALLVVLRERNALLLADTITVVHAKLLMSDLPAMLGAALFILAIIHWLKDAGRNQPYALLAGGVMGIFMLIRSELAAMIPFVGLGSLFVLARKPVYWIRGMSMVILGCVLVISPWIWRNWQTLGTPFLDVPGDHLDFIEFGDVIDQEGMANSNVEVKVQQRPADPSQKSDRPYSQVEPIGFVENLANHIVNGSVQSVLFLPMSSRMTYAVADLYQNYTLEKFLRNCCSPETYVRKLPYWWSDWDGALAPQSTVSMLFVMLFLALGYVAVKRTHGARVWVPIFAWIAHLVIYALIRRSGGRFILEIDWIILMFYGIGIIEMGKLFFGKLIDRNSTNRYLEAPRPVRMPHFSFLALGLFLVGFTLPIAENLFPERYDQGWIDSRLTTIQESENLLTPLQDASLSAETFINESDILYGRALYPRYYRAGDGMAGDDGKFEFGYPRIEIYLIGDTHQWFILPSEVEPVWFPHGSDVIIFRCPTDKSSSNLAFAVFDADGVRTEIYWHSEIAEIVECFDQVDHGK